MPMVEECDPQNRDEEMRHCCFDYWLPLQCLSPHTTHWWRTTDTLFLKPVRVILVFLGSLLSSFAGTSFRPIFYTTWMTAAMATNVANVFRAIFEVMCAFGTRF